MFIHHTRGVILSQNFAERGAIPFWALPSGRLAPRCEVQQCTSQASTPGRSASISPSPSRNRCFDRVIRDSGRIFAGAITGSQQVQDGPDVPIMRVAFRVDVAIRERYQIGERVLLFYPQSKLGLTALWLEIWGGGLLRAKAEREIRPRGNSKI